MTKPKMTESEIIPGYDPIKCKREAHARTREATKGMKPHEVREYYRKSAERFDEEQRHRRAEQQAAGLK